MPELRRLGPFSVFWALYLGITRDDGWARQDPAAASRAFGRDLEDLDRFLADHQLTEEDLSDRKFDFAGARYDINVAPAGIIRVELARSIYEELLQAESA